MNQPERMELASLLQVSVNDPELDEWSPKREAAEDEAGLKEEWELHDHHCKATLPPSGYGQAIVHCLADVFGRMWAYDEHGRKGTQVLFCPFCGCKALDSTPPLKSLAITAQDIALTSPDTPQRQWRDSMPQAVPLREQLLFGLEVFGRKERLGAVRDGLLWECWVWDQDQAAVDVYLT